MKTQTLTIQRSRLEIEKKCWALRFRPVRKFFLLTAGIYVSTGVIIDLFGMFDLTLHGERYCVSGEFWKDTGDDQLLLYPDDETIWYYAHGDDDYILVVGIYCD